MSAGDLMILLAVCFLLPCIIQAKSKFAVLAAGAGRVGLIFFFKSRLSYLPFLMPHLLGDGWTF